ncbi:hypothetical protein GF337_15875 [candidate division KSB1 bacterium]|nr:hypothetical protein [candidate division KSB1 bacterium]
MLTIKCAGCKSKLWKYEKLGRGEVLRCYKKRIQKIYGMNVSGDKIVCKCGNVIGIDKGGHIKMIGRAFTYSGTKQNK